MNMDDATITALAQHLAQLLRARLDDLSAETVPLSREEAAMLLGLAEGVAEYMVARDTSEDQ